MRLIRPNKTEFLALFGPDVKSIWICTPWVSTEGVQYLREGLDKTSPTCLREIELWIRLNSKDYELGLSDYICLAELMEEIVDRVPDLKFSIWSSDNLHAKFFVTDRGALLGSCNLTWAGFENNIELAVRLEPKEVFDQLSLRDVMRTDLGQVSTNDWKDFIHSLNKASRSSVAEAAVGKDGSWESFIQGLLAEGPPHLKTHLR